MIVDQTIEKVSFCAPDRNHEKGFAYICRDGTTRRWMCHGFLAVKESVSVSIIYYNFPLVPTHSCRDVSMSRLLSKQPGQSLLCISRIWSITPSLGYIIKQFYFNYFVLFWHEFIFLVYKYGMLNV